MTCVQAAEGWTTKALQLASQDLNLSPMFAGVCSEKDLVEYFVKSSNERLFERIRSGGEEFHSLPVPDKVKLAVRWRLEMLSPYISALFPSLSSFFRCRKLHVSSLHDAASRMDVVDCPSLLTSWHWTLKQLWLQCTFVTKASAQCWVHTQSALTVWRACLLFVSSQCI